LRAWALGAALLSAGCFLPRLVHWNAMPSPAEQATAHRLSAHVTRLAGDIGPRHVGREGALAEAERYVTEQLRGCGCQVGLQQFEVSGRTVANIEAEVPGAGRASRIVIVGAHYDSIASSPGADDNASGVAALVELAARSRNRRWPATVRFVAFVNEEPPWFQSPSMGSVVYARRSRARGDQVEAMLSLETIGYYSNEPHSQHYPRPFGWFFPSRGNFIAATSNFRSAGVLRRIARAFERGSPLRIIGSPAPERIAGIGWSDHWSFWQEGYPAAVLTDTAPYRYPHYHRGSDTPDKLDYIRMARVVDGVDKVLDAITR
jgi:Zn-dependent M28 family amino/carboxypeptidase